MEVKIANVTHIRQLWGGSSHPECNKLVEDIEDVWVEVLCEQQRLQRRTVPLHLVRVDTS